VVFCQAAELKRLEVDGSIVLGSMIFGETSHQTELLVVCDIERS
jgi:hypothetical protein